MVNRRSAPDLESYKMLVGDAWRDASNDATLESVDPFTCKPWASVPVATDHDVDEAVQAARYAFQEGPWGNSTPVQRARVLRTFGDLIGENAEELARVQVLENGRLIRDVGGRAQSLANYAYFFAGVAESPSGETLASSVPHTHVFTVREPLGVVAAITPWNSPLTLLLWKLCPALAAGNTIVVKPSEITPVSTLVIARLLGEAGLPDGVVNVVTGAGPTGAALASHPDVAKIAFTGSTPVGKEIARVAGGRLARVSLELGGKSPNIVFPDADLANALNGVLTGIFTSAGQMCMAGSRVLVHTDIYDDFCAALVARAEEVTIGDPLDPATEMGPLACRGQFEKVLQYVEIAARDGARLATGGGRAEAPELADGLFIRPTVFTHVDNQMRIAREEVFGPVAVVIPFDDEDDAVAIANDTDFGLAAGVWTNDLGLAHRMVRRLRAGTVWVNTYRKTNHVAPFGGFKSSGIGRENGALAMQEYTEVKTTWIDTGGRIVDPFSKS